MKKYVKPELFFESFELSQSIAACGIDVHYADETTCQPKLDPNFWKGDNYTVFNEGVCEMTTGDIDVYCYTVGTNEAGRLFNS